MSIVKHQSKHNGNVVQVPGKATINGTAFVISIALNALPTLKYCTLKGPQKILKAKTYNVSLGLWILRKRRLKIAEGFLTQGGCICKYNTAMLWNTRPTSFKNLKPGDMSVFESDCSSCT